MICTIKKSIAFLVVVCIVSSGLPRSTPASPESQPLTRGAATSKQAAELPVTRALRPVAAISPVSMKAVTHAVSVGQPVLAIGALNAYAQPDTSEFEFPEEENEHLARDITVWVIVASFVAFFIVKVFIEDDDEEPEDDGPPGKQI
jgi:hypothetical protein